MAVSFINSIFSAFGSGVVAGETGIMLHNRGSGFSLESAHPNQFAPGKRPFHTLIPAMVFKDGRLLMSYGVMGGDIQAQGHVQVLVNLVDRSLNLQQAIDAPRFRYISGKGVMLEDIAYRTGHRCAHREGPRPRLCRHPVSCTVR